jgi:hypothetical protein
MKKTICKILRTNKNNNFKFTIKFLMTLDRSYIGYLGFLGIDFLKSARLVMGCAAVNKELFSNNTIWKCVRCRVEHTFNGSAHWSILL